MRLSINEGPKNPKLLAVKLPLLGRGMHIIWCWCLARQSSLDIHELTQTHEDAGTLPSVPWAIQDQETASSFLSGASTVLAAFKCGSPFVGAAACFLALKCGVAGEAQ